ncbi:MAG: PocR ligand-binding domain-containing protein [Deltaproteobacteria bacterium]|nr:PocR ligand-binding domain-containing protein [Deltaproteobacteria bacterium]MBN2670467.1 PocR ligand-binding domain-containing protein [Deltaproteobacteria bacterium]
MDPIEPVFTTSLKDLVDEEALGEVFHNFLSLFKVPLRLFAENGNLILESSIPNPACEFLNKTAGSRSRCLVVRQRVKAAAPSMEGKASIAVKCFCGLQYLVVPIVFQSKQMGRLAIGPYFPKELEKLPTTLVQVEPNLDMKTFKTHYVNQPRYSEKRIRQFVDTVLSTMDCIFFAVHKSNVTEQMHTAMVRESYREISEKNRKLEEIVEERKEFDRRKSNFLAMVSHELRTPLTSIIGYSDMLAEGIAGDLADEQKQFVQTIKSKGDELLKIISSILDFSKIDSGRLSVNAIPCDVSDIIETALKNHRELAKRRGVNLSVQLAQDIPTVQMDPEKIITSVSHLVDNAIKFSVPGGTIRITAQVMASSEADVSDDGIGFVLLATPDLLEIAVTDYGIGIESEHMEIIFSPFTQADESSTREHGGAGMGLAIVKQYVEAHGGRVHVQSTKGEGSSFAIRIPLLDAQS